MRPRCIINLVADDPGMSGRGRVVAEAGALLRNLRQRRGLSQARLAQRSGGSQQWLSQVERGVLNPTLADLERFFASLGMRLRIEATPDDRSAYEDPELALDLTDDQRDGLASEYGYLLGKLSDVPLLVSGRLAALAHGLPVRVRRLDLLIAEAQRPQFAAALRRFGALRWNERWQEFCDHLPAERPGPMRWRIGDKWELRVVLVSELPAGLELAVGTLALPVPALPWLLAHDADVAELLGRLERLGWRPGQSPAR